MSMSCQTAVSRTFVDVVALIQVISQRFIVIQMQGHWEGVVQLHLTPTIFLSQHRYWEAVEDDLCVVCSHFSPLMLYIGCRALV